MELNLISSAIIGYLFGCFSTAFIVGKAFNNIDIREHGSGNAGATNVIRVMGWKAGIIAFLGDFFKAVLAILLVRYLFQNTETVSYTEFESNIIVITAAIGVIIGHNWPVFLNFKGGKGVASTIGVLAAINFPIALITGLIMIAIIAITRYVSLASITGAIIIPIIFWFLDFTIPNMVFASILGILTIYKHRGNIKRLIEGTESKIGKKK